VWRVENGETAAKKRTPGWSRRAPGFPNFFFLKKRVSAFLRKDFEAIRP
jgi:hypothetical protein